MPRLRKSKRPAVSTPTPPPEPVQNPTSRGSSRAPAISSPSITHTGTSPLDPPGDGTAVGGKDSGWQTVYSAARMAVDIAKESSDMFLPLKAVMGAVSVLMKNYDQKTDNADMVKGIEQRVQSLSGVLAAPVSEDDYAEKWRRMELRRKLEGVITKLEPLSKQHTLVGFFRNTDNAKELIGFIQELANAITDYQVSVQQGVYEKTRNIHDNAKNILGDTKNLREDTKNILGDTENIRGDTKNILEVAELEILAKLEPMHNAGYQAGHHEKCLPGTRESVLKDIVHWAKNPQEQNVFWLNGLAGTGKSTIAQSFSETISNNRLLGASFFCSRDYLGRKELKNIFPTLAYQLACHYTHFRRNIITNLKKDPTLTHSSLISQLENLIVNPLSGMNVLCIIVIDALDECIDDQPASAILSVLARFAKELPLVKFFITGRPEPRIRTGFRLPLLQPLTQIFLLHQVDPTSVSNDIRLYLAQKLTAIAKRRSDIDLPDLWPHDHEIEALTKKSSGLFIFASTLVRFIESEYHDPNERLQLVLSRTGGTIYEGHAGIDSLYSQILLDAFSGVHDSKVFAYVRQILGAIALAFNPLSRRELSVILGIPTTLVSTTLRHLHSVILVPADEHKEIRIFHKSFPDFLQDNERCTDVRLCVDPAIQHSDMALSCLELVKKLKRNPCGIPPFMMNQDIVDLPEQLENKLGGGVRYACGYWARHLELSLTSEDHVDQVVVLAIEMFRSSAPRWIEVMSLENQLEEVAHSMHCFLDWLDKATVTVQHELTITNLGKLTTSYKDTVTEHRAALAEHDQVISKHIHATTKYMNAATECRLAVHEYKVATTQDNDARVRYIIAKAKAGAVANDLATDCLRLSMHFFHPIQHCAQQVYHSALPLAPPTSHLHKLYLQSFMYNQLTYVAAFSSPPKDWGLLLRTINVRPKQLTCISASIQTIVAACGDIVNIYDAVTGVLRQTLHAPGRVKKIQGSPDGLILFFAHSLSITMWDVQTGGLAHTFTAQSKISDIAVSLVGDHIACGMSDGSVKFWDIHTKEGRNFGNREPVVTVYWLSPQEIAVATQKTLYIHDAVHGYTLAQRSIPGHVYGMVYLKDKGKFLVGTRLSKGTDQEWCTFKSIKYEGGHLCRPEGSLGHVSHTKRLSCPTLVDDRVICMTSPSGVQLLIASSCSWTHNPPLLDEATSVAVSSNRNLVVQTKDSIQIFSLDILMSHKAPNMVPPPCIYPLDEEHMVCLHQGWHPTLLKLETMQDLSPGNTFGSIELLLTDRLASAPASFGCGLIGKFGVSAFEQAWGTGAPLPTWPGMEEEVPLGRLSPEHTRIVTFRELPCPELHVLDAKQDLGLIAYRPLEHNELRTQKVYDIAFDSETRFYLKVEGPGDHVQIPYDIVALPSGRHSHTIIKRQPITLLEPRATPPYTVDANCEWVLDGASRKICWIPPGNIRRGSDRYFWAGLSLVMVGEDGVVRKLTFKEPDR